MTSCTQPGCTGVVVDGYCDICGSPAGAAPFVSAETAASAGPRAAVDDRSLMAACTQPACTGMVVDGYCDVCGSPEGAAPFVSAETVASAGSRPAVDDPGLTAVPAPTPEPSPVDEDTPTRLIPRMRMQPQQLSAEMVHPGATGTGAVDDDMPTRRIPKVQTPRQQVSGQQIADPMGADSQAVDARKVEGDKGLGEKSDVVQDYRARVEAAQLPDNVREAALSEVGKLERISDASSQSGDIRTWLDTILDLPWSTEAADWIDIQGSREVEAALRMLIEPTVADVELADAAEVESAEVESADVGEVEIAKVESPEVEAAEVESAEVESAVADVGEVEAAEVESAEVGAAVADVGEVEAVEAESGDVESAEVESAAAEVEQVDAADVGPQDDDTVEMAGAAAAFSGDRHVPPQPPEQHVAEPQPVQVPREKRRIRSLTLAATVLALLIGAFFLSANRDGGVRAQSVPSAVPNDGPTTTATVSQPTSVPSDKSTETVGEGETIQIEDFTDSARPFEAVRIQGRYPGGEDTFLQVQRRYEGKWVAFPLPTKTDQSGEFTAFVEPGPPGRYRLRVLDPDSGVTSKTFVVVVKG